MQAYAKFYDNIQKWGWITYIKASGSSMRSAQSHPQQAKDGAAVGGS
jgi:hypothetical protein